MNKEITWEKVDNCFANARTYRYHLPVRVDEEFVEKMGSLGSLFIKRNLRRPFFRIKTEKGVEVKGIFGDASVKVSFPEDIWEEGKRIWERQIAELTEEK